jgi:hypothetical protein
VRGPAGGRLAGRQPAGGQPAGGRPVVAATTDAVIFVVTIADAVVIIVVGDWLVD